MSTKIHTGDCREVLKTLPSESNSSRMIKPFAFQVEFFPLLYFFLWHSLVRWRVVRQFTLSTEDIITLPTQPFGIHLSVLPTSQTNNIPAPMSVILFEFGKLQDSFCLLIFYNQIRQNQAKYSCRSCIASLVAIQLSSPKLMVQHVFFVIVATECFCDELNSAFLNHSNLNSFVVKRTLGMSVPYGGHVLLNANIPFTIYQACNISQMYLVHITSCGYLDINTFCKSVGKVTKEVSNGYRNLCW